MWLWNTSLQCQQIQKQTVIQLAEKHLTLNFSCPKLPDLLHVIPTNLFLKDFSCWETRSHSSCRDTQTFILNKNLPNSPKYFSPVIEHSLSFVYLLFNNDKLWGVLHTPVKWCCCLCKEEVNLHRKSLIYQINLWTTAVQQVSCFFLACSAMKIYFIKLINTS